jgi:spore coat protein CotH
MKCDVVFDGTSLPLCGVKFKGNSSYNNPSDKKSFKVDFDAYINNQKYDGIKKINLNNGFKDPSFMREKLMLDFLNEQGLYAPRCSYANLYINGTLWGLYMVVEEINKKYLENTFGDDKGNLFKGDPSGDLKWLGPNASSYYSKYELKTNESINNWSDLVDFINTINNSSPATLQSNLDNIFNTDNYIKTWAIHGIFANLDSYMGSGHNYFIYHDSLTNKFQWITWDVNEAFGNFNMGMSISQLEGLSMFYIPNPTSNRPLNKNMLDVTSYKNKLVDAYCYYLNNGFDIWTLEPKIDSIANAIRPHVYADNKKFFSNQQFEDNIENNINVPGNPGGSNIPGIKSFITNRRIQLSQQLSSWFCTLSLTNHLVNKTAFFAYPNPAENTLYLNSINPSLNFEIIDITGKIVYSGKYPQNTGIDISDLQPSIYFIRTATGYATFVKQ